MNEIHELSLLYLHFELVMHGYHSIFLGQSVPIENLNDIQKIYNDVCFVTFLTVEPSNEDVTDYLNSVYENVLKNSNDEFWVLGPKTAQIPSDAIIPDQIKVFKSPMNVLKIL
jgi:hypothetical protein